MNLPSQTVGPMSFLVRAGKKQVHDVAADAAVAVIHGMKSFEPKVRDPGLQNRTRLVVIRYPLQKLAHLSFEPLGGGCLVMDHFAAAMLRSDHHRSPSIVPPAANFDRSISV